MIKLEDSPAVWNYPVMFRFKTETKFAHSIENKHFVKQKLFDGDTKGVYIKLSF